MEILHGYRENDSLRASFNSLAREVFGLDFEEWYQNGWWTDRYDPYSVVIDGRVVANISVNRCDMNYNGKTVGLVQLGTVMTHPDFRGRGYARAIMERILSEYEGKADGMYLYANDSAREFYPNFGFAERKEYVYSAAVSQTGERTAAKLPLRSGGELARAAEMIASSAQNASLYMVNNTGLYMFYLSQFMKDDLFYLPGCGAYVIAEEEGDGLVLHAVFGDCSVDGAVRAFGKSVKKVVLRFTPHDASGFDIRELDEEDTTLFVKGRFFDETADRLLTFQAISRA